MGFQIGDHWRELTAELVSAVQPEVLTRILDVVLELSADAIASWASAIAPAKYIPAGFTKVDAEILMEERPFQSLQEIVEVPGIGLAKAGDLVYAAAAAEAVDPRFILVEEVYDSSAFAGIEVLVRRQVAVPDPGPMCRLEVKAAYVALEGRSQTIELVPTIRQRDFEDTWAEIDVGHRQRIWMVGVSQSLLSSTVSSGRLLLFPRLGGDFLKTPTTVIRVATPPLSEPPESSFATDHQFFGFPEIEGELFMLRARIPPDPEFDEHGLPVDPNWPFAYRFHAEGGDLLLFGPSYPTDIEVGTGGKEVLYRHSGVLTASDRSRDLASEVQPVIDRLRERLSEEPDLTSTFLLTAISRRPGQLAVGFEADVDAIVDRFGNDTNSHKMMFTSSSHSAELPLYVPMLGDPMRASIAVKGQVSRNVIEQELGMKVAATGGDRIGVRLSGDVSYRQTFAATGEFSVSAIDIRLAHVAAGTTLRVTVAGEATSVDARAELVVNGREPSWQTMRLDEPLLLVAEATHAIRVALDSGSATWLCGSGSPVHHLERVENLGLPAMMVDVTDSTPLAGQVRLRRYIPLDEPDIKLSLVPGDYEVELTDVVVAPDGSFEARIDLVAGLRAMSGHDTVLRVETRSEGELTLYEPDIGYHFRIETEQPEQ